MDFVWVLVWVPGLLCLSEVMLGVKRLSGFGSFGLVGLLVFVFLRSGVEGLGVKGSRARS